MVHILLLILKWLGITLLILLSIVLLVIILFLIVPFRYKIDAEYYGDLKAVGRIRWLCFVLDLKGLYGDSKFLYYLKSFGFTISTNDENDKHYKKPPEEDETDAKPKKTIGSHTDKANTTVPEDDFEAFIKESEENQAPARETITSTENNHPAPEKKDEVTVRKGIFTKLREKCEDILEGITTIPEKIHYKISEILTRILDFFANITENIRKLAKKWDEIEKKARRILAFIKKESTKRALKDAVALLKKLLRHVMPRKYYGKVHFGTEDPASTGQLLGVIGMLMPLYRDNIIVAPDFEQKIFEGDIHARGRVQLGFVAIWAIKVLMNRNLMDTIKKGNIILGGNK